MHSFTSNYLLSHRDVGIILYMQHLHNVYLLSLITLITTEYYSQQDQNKTKNYNNLTQGPTTQLFFAVVLHKSENAFSPRNENLIYFTLKIGISIIRFYQVFSTVSAGSEMFFYSLFFISEMIAPLYPFLSTYQHFCKSQFLQRTGRKGGGGW